MPTQRSDQYYIQFRLQPVPGQSPDVPARQAVIDQPTVEAYDDKFQSAWRKADVNFANGNMAPRNSAQFTALCQADPLDFAALEEWLKSHGYLEKVVDSQ